MVKFGNIISATVSVSNTENEDRAFDIVAEVTANNGDVLNINKGEVRSKEDGNLIATFTLSNTRYLSVSIFRYGTDDASAILKEIDGFIESIKQTDVTSLWHNQED